MRAIAIRNLEQTAGAVIQASLDTTLAERDHSQWHQWMARLTELARATYRDLVYGDEAFSDYFRAATPIDVIERMRIGSRPASRAKKDRYLRSARDSMGLCLGPEPPRLARLVLGWAAGWPGWPRRSATKHSRTWPVNGCSWPICWKMPKWPWPRPT